MAAKHTIMMTETNEFQYTDNGIKKTALFHTRSVDSVSATTVGRTQQITVVSEFPPSASCRRRVNLELRYGIWLKTAIDTIGAAITNDRWIINILLILLSIASCKQSPVSNRHRGSETQQQGLENLQYAQQIQEHIESISAWNTATHSGTHTLTVHKLKPFENLC